MMAQFFRLDYDMIKKIMGSFKGREAATQQSIQKLSKVIEQLRGGDWIGEGATAFFNEMDSEVMPAMKRLQNAMTEGDRVSKEIERLQRETENSISSFFTAILSQFSA
jgi:WXG100 family type VII secretion target